ncbi:ABC-ATPase domain-containing protein [Thermosediminibacter oceani]|uniref:ABC transporter, ATPase, predicted n=1 Tax=Thermosediminibacter oceani (strain ATCC BAA-1034 / DSM 16646 / JW/IW-1228P) TaxID=555079 RepID=D9S212_THEOJ|nr:ABC-ATPase domain-containing protein [Thermosediminibacter oceani]ADL07439.1 ABC transporter, ATPase, predicted [Thermosediminibacter oceani DSM 16646]
MRSKEDLKKIIARINGKGYKAYKEIQGDYDFGGFVLYIDHVQGDPFASPSRVRLWVDMKRAGFPEELYKTSVRTTALEDFLARQAAAVIRKLPRVNGTGGSGEIYIDKGGQEILKRTAVKVCSDYVEARLSVGLPAFGRRINGGGAETLFFSNLPEIAEKALLYRNIDAESARKWVELAEDQEYLRDQLKKSRLVAFVADGSILPRESGISDRPMRGDRVVPFKSPESLKVSFELPNAGVVGGMGIPEGVTLIVGGGYHGKTTLLSALQRGVYNHIPGDGREFVITVKDAVKIRAEDGRRVEKVDISPFITNLPDGQDTRKFSTENASGSTSQAANIMEAVEIGTSLLLLDEDTCATNFMIRDARMQKLVAKEKEPITPFIDRVRQLYEELGISTVLVMGGSGDYFDMADCVIKMQDYRPYDVTEEARRIAAEIKTDRRIERTEGPISVTPRVILKEGLELRGKKKVKSRDVDTLQYGGEYIEMDYVEQLVDRSQTSAVGEIIRYAVEKYVDGGRTFKEIVEMVFADIEKYGIDVVSPFYGKHPGNLALPRPQEVAAGLNRYRGLRVK